MASMKAANRLMVALKGASPAFGCWQMIPGSNVSRTLARTGVDWVLVDQEHGNIDGQSNVSTSSSVAVRSRPISVKSGIHDHMKQPG